MFKAPLAKAPLSPLQFQWNNYMTLNLPDDFIDILKDTMHEAGTEILKYHANARDHVIRKQDGSPVTLADQASEKIIIKALKSLTPNIPIIAEELFESGHTPNIDDDEYFWLVDPLDGTKEFIKGTNDFVINIALIHNQTPVFGVVYEPYNKNIYYGGVLIQGAYKNNVPVLLKECNDVHGLTMIGKRMSTITSKIKKYLPNHKVSHFTTRGSSIKFCMIADGTAHFYPRFVPTYEWDTAAAHAMLLQLGGDMIDLNTGQRLEYRKDNYLNGFILTGTNEVLGQFKDFDF